MANQAKKLKGTPHRPELARLKRVEGQVRGIAKMVEDERYCIDILTQLKAVKSALASIERNIIEDHLNHCMHKAIDSNNKKEAQQMVEEIKELLKSAKV